MIKKILFILLFFIMSVCIAAEDYYQFHSPLDKVRFHTLTTELRCLVCQNQNIAESNASLATDLREQIYKKIQKGESDREIIDYLVARYGNFILYQPPFNMATLGLWLGPFLILIFGIIYLLFYLKKSSR